MIKKFHPFNEANMAPSPEVLENLSILKDIFQDFEDVINDVLIYLIVLPSKGGVIVYDEKYSSFGDTYPIYDWKREFVSYIIKSKHILEDPQISLEDNPDDPKKQFLSCVNFAKSYGFVMVDLRDRSIEFRM